MAFRISDKMQVPGLLLLLLIWGFLILNLTADAPSSGHMAWYLSVSSAALLLSIAILTGRRNWLSFAVAGSGVLFFIGHFVLDAVVTDRPSAGLISISGTVGPAQAWHLDGPHILTLTFLYLGLTLSFMPRRDDPTRLLVRWGNAFVIMSSGVFIVTLLIRELLNLEQVSGSSLIWQIMSDVIPLLIAYRLYSLFQPDEQQTPGKPGSFRAGAATAGSIAIVLAIVFWYLLDIKQWQERRSEARFSAASAETILTRASGDLGEALYRLADRMGWYDIDGRGWEREAELYLKDFDHIRSLAYLDGAGSFIKYSDSTDSIRTGTELLTPPSMIALSDTLEKARHTDFGYMSGILQGHDGSELIAIVFPTSQRAQTAGFVVAFLKLNWFSQVLENILPRGYQVAVSMGDQAVSGAPVEVNTTQSLLTQKFDMELWRQPVSVRLWPTTELLQRSGVALPFWVMFAGLVVAILASSLVEAVLRRRQAQKEAQDLSIWHDAIIEQMSDAYVAIDHNGTIIYANSNALALIDKPRKDVIRQPLYDAVPTIADTDIRSIIEASQNRKKVGEVTVYAAGREQWLHITVESVETGSLIVAQDITEQHVSEQLQKLENQVYRMISNEKGIEQISDTVIQSLQAMYPDIRISVMQLDGTVLRNVGHPHFSDDYIRLLQALPVGPAVGACGTAAYDQAPVVVSDVFNDQRWVDYVDYARQEGFGACWSIPVISSEGKVLGTLAAYCDTPKYPGTVRLAHLNTVARYLQSAFEHGHYLAMMRESESRFRLVSSATNEAIWDWGVKDNKVWYNNRAVELFGTQNIGKSPLPLVWTESIHPDDRKKIRNELLTIGTDTDRLVQEFRMNDAHGLERYMLHHCMVMKNEDDSVQRIIGSLLDVTRQYELEKDLYQAQKMESIGQLTGGIAHDFNNLLTVIIGNSEFVLEGGELSEDIRELIAMVLHAAERGADLTHQLLAFSRRQPLKPAAVAPSRMVDRILPMIERTLTSSVEINALALNARWSIFVDQTQLESAILNLSINARDAMDGQGKLLIGTEDVSLNGDDIVEDGDYVLICIKDTGSGMSEEVRRHIFEPFYTTKDVGKGTGLGLSMVYGFVKQSGGEVTVDSEPGKGAVFKLYFPKCDTSAKDSDENPVKFVAKAGGTMA